MRYRTYENGIEGTYTEEQMRNLYTADIDKTEYATFEDWKADMLKSGVFEKEEETMYYDINEAMARTAKTLNSFGDYSNGSATEQYRKMVDHARNIADGKTLSDGNDQSKLEYLVDRYAKRLATWYNRYYAIESMCPSIMISGAGNFPVRKKEQQNRMREKHHEEYKKIEYLLDQINDFGCSSGIIKSSESDALDQLKEKHRKLVENHENMKKMNAYFRKHNTMIGFPDLSEESAKKIDAEIEHAYSWDKKPCASFTMTNSLANIKNVEGRIIQLEKIKNCDAESEAEKFQQVPGIDVVVNKELVRYQLIFDGKPSEDIRNILKSNGFKWSPNNSAWQRQITANGKYALKTVLDKISKL